MVSVIVPIYNNEKYLSRCVESIINQTYSDWELILVNDGSTDNCEKICQRFSEEDHRIKCVSKINEGVSVARNVGISISRGEYVSFIDSDDYVAQNYLEKLMCIQKKYNADFVAASFHYVDNDGIRDNPFFEVPVEYQEKQIDMKDYEFEKWYSFPGACGCLFSKKIIEQNQISFSNKYRNGEDMLFKIQYLTHSDKPVAISEPLYYYFENPKSVLHTVNVDVLVEAILAWEQAYYIVKKYSKCSSSIAKVLIQYCRKIKTDGLLYNMLSREQKKTINRVLSVAVNAAALDIKEKLAVKLVMYAPLIYRAFRKFSIIKE